MRHSSWISQSVNPIICIQVRRTSIADDSEEVTVVALVTENAVQATALGFAGCVRFFIAFLAFSSLFDYLNVKIELFHQVLIAQQANLVQALASELCTDD